MIFNDCVLTMKQFSSYIVIIFIGIGLYSCDDSSYLVGSNNVIELDDVIFTITEYTVEDSTRLNATGTATTQKL